MPWIDALLQKMAEVGASDLHLTSAQRPKFRLHGRIVDVDGCPELSPEEVRQVVYEITPPENRAQFDTEADTDFAYEVQGLARFRANVFLDRRGVGAVIRLIPARIPSAEQLGLPKAALDLCHLSKGLVLVTGPTGSGKSTTLAALIDHINQTRSDHIITIEDPIEFVHQDKRCLIHQREVHRHTGSFKRALRAALREDPDIILVGELRDLETIEIAVETAETGHLVFGTLHTSTAASTVDRIIDQFPADRQAQIRTMLAASLKGVVAQTLCQRIPAGRVAAIEIMIGNTAISANIREGKSHQIPSAMQTGGKLGMRLLNDALIELVKGGLVDPNEAYFKAIQKEDLVSKLAAIGKRVELSAPAEAAEHPAGQAPAGSHQPAGSRGAAPSSPARPVPRAPLPSQPAPGPSVPTGHAAVGLGDPFDQFKRQRTS